MNTILPHDFSINKYGATLKLINLEDADFIIRLRHNDKKSKFIHKISGNIIDQENWIRDYLVKEKRGNEYYFITFNNNDNIPYGTTRLYNFTSDSFETGSWVFLDNSPEGLSIIGDILGREVGYEILGFDYCTFEVRKANSKVIRYHKMYKPDIIGEDDLNIYFKLDRDKFNFQKEKFLKIYNYGNK